MIHLMSERITAFSLIKSQHGPCFGEHLFFTFNKPTLPTGRSFAKSIVRQLKKNIEDVAFARVVRLDETSFYPHCAVPRIGLYARLGPLLLTCSLLYSLAIMWNKWRVSSQNGLYPFWSILDIWDLSCWNIKKILREFVILLIITSDIYLYV